MFEITPNLSPSPDFALALWQGNGTEQPLDYPDGIEVNRIYPLPYGVQHGMVPTLCRHLHNGPGSVCY